MHAMMAKKEGATREEVISAVSMNLHLYGLSNVLECLPQQLKVMKLIKNSLFFFIKV